MERSAMNLEVVYWGILAKIMSQAVQSGQASLTTCVRWKTLDDPLNK